MYARKINAAILLFAVAAVALLWACWCISAQAKPSVAVLGFKNNANDQLPSFSGIAQDVLIRMLVKTGKFNVIEREYLEEILDEQDLSVSGLADVNASAIGVGKLLAADYIVVGSLNSFDYDTVLFSGYGTRSERIISSVTGDLRLVNTTTGHIEQVVSFSATHEEVLLRGTYDKTLESTLQTLLEKAFAKALPELTASVKEETKQESVVLDEVIVYVDSKPEGARVYLDGWYCGFTPLTLTTTPGRHLIEIYAAGYSPWVKEIIAFDGLRVNAVLQTSNR